MSHNEFSININNCGLLDPQIELGKALSNGNIREFRIALYKGAEPTLSDNKNLNIYEKALSTYGAVEFVGECLRNDCSPYYVNRRLNKSAINFAADSRDPRIIKVLLQCKGIQTDHKYANLTPLNSLAKNITTENINDVEECIKALLLYGASPNIPDQREMTPLHYILKNRKIDANKKRELVQLFLDLCDLDVDTYRDGEVRNILQDDYPNLQLPEERNASTLASSDWLLMLLRRGDEQKFIENFENYRRNSNLEQCMPLLLESIKGGLNEASDLILNSDIDINGKHNKNTPIEIAAVWGNWYTLEKLLKNENLKISRENDPPLIIVLKRLNDEPVNDFCDYQKCFDYLLNSEKIDVNATDRSGSTALHYAVKYRYRNAELELLKRGAYIGVKSDFNDLPIDGIHPEILEEQFDNCITTNGRKPGDENFEIILNFINLIPHKISDYPSKAVNQNLRDEMTPITFIASSREHRHLLQHPLITSFLFLKWHRLSLIFYINFLFYTFFALSIIAYTVVKFRESENEVAKTLLALFSWIGIAYLIIREAIQFIMSPRLYFRSFINWMEIILIFLSIITCIESSYDQETQRVIAVITMLLVALELCLLVGSLPVLSISTHMLMLRAVSNTFLKSFTLYSIFVITFSLCFYILFGKEKADENSDGGEFNKFTNPFTAIIKTIVMLTGEFDAGDIQFDTFYSYLFFLLFVVFMSIVLFNLLNGLAVSDTQAIKAQAELNGSICRVQLLSRYEGVLTGRSGHASFIVNHEPFRTICERLINLYPNFIATQSISILPNSRNKVLIEATKDLINQDYENFSPTNSSHNSKTKFLPFIEDNDRQKKPLKPPLKLFNCFCSCITNRCSEMDARTVKLAMAIIEQKSIVHKHRNQQMNTEQRLLKIEQTLEKVLDILQVVQNK